jgi:hypothetical protein
MQNQETKIYSLAKVRNTESNIFFYENTLKYKFLIISTIHLYPSKIGFSFEGSRCF